MYNTRNLALIFGAYRNTIAVITHRNDGILQIRAVRTVYHGIQLAADFVVGLSNTSADMAQCCTGIVGNFFFRQNTAP